jgi:phosphoenolpyruvate-protein kinase (PTS system EI component)
MQTVWLAARSASNLGSFLACVAMKSNHLQFLCDVGELGALLAGSSDIAGFLQQIVGLIARHLEAHVCSICLCENATQELVLRATQHYIDILAGSQHAYVREEVQDIEDVVLRVLDNLWRDAQHTYDTKGGRIVIASDLYPSELVMLSLDEPSGIVLMSGGATSHVSILARAIVDAGTDELRSRGICCHPRPSIGMMVELPSVLEAAQESCREADFFSIGSNDFIQYMLAADRGNESVASYYCPHHPAVLRGIARFVRTAQAHDRPVSVCGEMAHQKQYIPFLLGVGVRSSSVDPHVQSHRQRSPACPGSFALWSSSSVSFECSRLPFKSSLQYGIIVPYSKPIRHIPVDVDRVCCSLLAKRGR